MICTITVLILTLLFGESSISPESSDGFCLRLELFSLKKRSALLPAGFFVALR